MNCKSIICFILLFCIKGIFAGPTKSSIGYENPAIFELNVVFRKISHQNPWMTGEPFSRKTKSISLGKGLFFAITLSQQKPIYARFDALDFSSSKLQIESYDPESGFLLLRNPEPDRVPYQVSLEEKKESELCPNGKKRYVQLPFSKTFFRIILLEKKESEEPQFLISNGQFCGILINEGLIPAEYIRFFLNLTGDMRFFPHPGILFDTNPTPSERSYYIPEGVSGILVSEVFPGIGPAYSLFPGDVLIAIGGKTLDKVPDWDKRDRVLDLILRDEKGNLKKPGQSVSFRIYRNRRFLDVNYTLSGYQTKSFLIPEQADNMRPLYYIQGGFFFTELTGSYLKEFGEDYRYKSDKKLLFLLDFYPNKIHPLREKIVILSRVFPMNGNTGYQDWQDLVLQTVNGDRISTLKQLKDKIETSNTKYFAFEFSGGKIAVFSRADLKTMEEELISSYKISKPQNIEEK